MNLLRLSCWMCLFFSAVLWLDCRSTTSEEKPTGTVQKPEVSALPAVAQAQLLAQQFGPFIKGAWVKADYLAAVQKSESPLKASDLTGPVSEILINPTEQSADSLVAGLGLGNHEGGSMSIYFKPGLQPNSLPTSYRYYESAGSFSELSYNIGASDTTLVLTTYNKNHKVLARATYQRVHGASLANLVALNQAVRQLLFVGRYTGTDSIGRAVQMEFTASGRFQGLNGFRAYDVQTDFLSDTIDYLTLDAETKHIRHMGFRRSADTLRLYAAREEDNPVPTMVRGRLLFTLVRH